ncbi:craniofacial development protein 1 isoform X2 [Colossoma macropomum]|uniref:craniofacial development protein 1 isoform X2 n=1 Tax=Colossoma macropomum TaxID=42526 RepID=UPI001863F25B|nr:craniofacial development protein 1 isoform X2 [Colossoma macropomum]
MKMMNYSDYDSEDYSSNEDEDYVPSDDNLSEDDINECEKEDGLEGEEQNEPRTDHVKKKKKSSKGLSVRKRKKGGLKLEEGDEDGSHKQEKEVEEEEGEKAKEDVSKSVENEEKQKKKADDLWASFLKDVGPRPLAQSPASEQSMAMTSSDEPSKNTTESSEQEPKPKEPSRITITKVFDFAGEEVRVTKEVDANSREAKSFLKKEEKVEEMQEQQSLSIAPSSLTPGPSAKRPAGMGSVLNRIGAKKQKMSTLEKSKLDWDAFKTEEGITDELAIHNRGKEGADCRPKAVWRGHSK